jgi:hypothetical protein
VPLRLGALHPSQVEIPVLLVGILVAPVAEIGGNSQQNKGNQLWVGR